jgi:hypothetical protein
MEADTITGRVNGDIGFQNTIYSPTEKVLRYISRGVVGE